MGSSKKVTVGYKYYMGLHFGLCHGPVDALHQVTVGDREAWSGTQATSGALAIYAPELFGGDKREGGIDGVLDVMMGEPAQAENAYLVSKLGAAIPAFRGILSAVWRGGQVAANNPYVKPWAFRVKRILQGWSTGSAWYSAKAQIAGGFCDPRTTVIPEIALDALNADPVGAYGITYATSPADVLTIEYTNGRTHDAYSWFSTDDDPLCLDGLPWGCQVSVKADGITTDYRTTRYPTAAAANAAALAGGPIVLTGHSSYTIFIYDTYSINNRGGLSLRISISSAPAHVNMNPAHIVYQCLTDIAWGMGYPTASIDNASFTAAADALYAEGFGLSFLWTQQETIENFIQVVLDHIGALLYVRPDTGGFALKLIRSDYDRNTLPLYDAETLISAADYQRQAWGETINELSVVYTDPCTGKDATVTAQDMANVEIQGGVVAQTRNYPGIRQAELAQRVALRDLQAVSTPLARIKLTATRAAWQVFPGDVFRLSWPEYDIADVVYRVLAVNRGTLQNGEIIIDVVEDVFGLPDNTYLAEQPGEWVDPANPPAVANYRKFLEAPYWDLVRSLSPADMAYVDSLSGYLETLAVRPSGSATNYAIQARTGSAAFADVGNGDFCPSATVGTALGKTTTALTLSNGIDLDLVIAGSYAIIDDEYVLVSAIDASAGTATIARGVLDTVPTEHAAGARIWFADGNLGFGSTEYADGEALDVKLLPATGSGELSASIAPIDLITFDQRQYRPYPPGKLRVNTVEAPEWIDGQSELSVTWAHRDRLAQTAYIVTQDESSIGPEAAVSYNLRIYGETDALIHTESGAGTSYTYPAVTEIAECGANNGGTLNWSNVITALSFPGADGSTTITDGKSRAWTAVGNAQIDNSLGYNTLLLDGSGDHITATKDADFDWYAYDYTIEAWVNPVDLATWSYDVTGITCPVMIGWRDVAGSESAWDFGPIANGALVFRYYTTASQSIITPAGLITNNALVHIAMSKVGTSIKLSVAGVIQQTATRAGTSLISVSRPIVIGQGNNRSLNGRIKGILITKGVGKYMANFTPPPAPFGEFEYVGYAASGRLRIELESVRGGLASYQKHNHTVLREGYGFNYGYYYGGQ